MPLKVLDLEPITLTCAAEDLKLLVTPQLSIELPSRRLASLDNTELIKNLTDGKVWVCRGRACRLDLQLFFNGRLLEHTTRMKLLESLGYSIRDAHLWSQLFLSTSLQIPQQTCPLSSRAEIPAHISVFLNHFTRKSPADIYASGWVLDNVDVNPPESVLSVKFEKLHLRLDFDSLNTPKQPASKKSRRPQEGLQPRDAMLLNYTPELPENDHLEIFSEAVERLSSLSTSITNCFLSPQVRLSQPSPVASNHQAVLNETTGYLFPIESTNILRNWFALHLQNPYPSRHEKEELATESALSLSKVPLQSLCQHSANPSVTLEQVDSWMTRKRSHQRKSTTSPHIAINGLLQRAKEVRINPRADAFPEEQDENTMLLALENDDPCSDQEEMLFPQPPSVAPSLMSHTSNLSTETMASSSNSRKRSLQPDDLYSTDCRPSPVLTRTSICNFTAVALQTLINGSLPRSQPSFDIKAKSSIPTSTLAALAPSLFSPGYRQLVAHNANYMPTISRALCSSLVRNVQGPGLRRKLMALSEGGVSELNDDMHSKGSTERMTVVVQSRVWAMVQRVLLDSRNAKKLKWEKSPLGPEGLKNGTEEAWDDGGEDLLGGATTEMTDDFAFAFDDDGSPFIDLLLGNPEPGDDEGLLSYLEERERIEVELETDEILFGSKLEDGDMDDCLLLEAGFDEVDSMLL